MPCLLYTSTLHPDNMGAGPAAYGMTDTMGRMHSDAQFAGSSSVPAHVEMMGFLGMGNNLSLIHICLFRGLYNFIRRNDQPLPPLPKGFPLPFWPPF